jgi:hypothetical protein
MKRKSTLLEAENLINGIRQGAYDKPERNFERISIIASVLVGKQLSAIDCIKVLMATKLAREAFKHKRDNIVDLAGYAEILDMVENA